jgi:hypothetical protein
LIDAGVWVSRDNQAEAPVNEDCCVMVTPQLFWLRDNQDENVVAWKVLPG